MEITSNKRLQLLSGSSDGALAQDVAKALGVKLGKTRLSRFANTEINCRLDESVRASDVFIFQTHAKPVNEAIMEQAIMIDAAKRASAKHITAVCPFFGYARQDRKAAGREPITAKLIVDILTAAGADRIVSIDLHSGQIQGFFDGPFDHLTAMPLLREYIQKNFKQDAVIVAPDDGRVKVAAHSARLLNSSLAIVYKRRSTEKANTVEALELVGQVKGRTCVIMDDMVDTAGTLCAAVDLLRKQGARQIYAMATHAVLSKPAVERLRESSIDKVVVTDTLPLEPEAEKLDKIEVLSVAPVIAGAITAIFSGESVSELFAGENQL
jgi:ribose-phosphate pyrophosphokinase